jgi:hypothetical protein
MQCCKSADIKKSVFKCIAELKQYELQNLTSLNLVLLNDECLKIVTIVTNRPI